MWESEGRERSGEMEVIRRGRKRGVRNGVDEKRERESRRDIYERGERSVIGKKQLRVRDVWCKKIKTKKKEKKKKEEKQILYFKMDTIF